MYFTSEKLRYYDGLDGTYTIDQDLALVTNNWHTIKVPKGFTCNGSSIPRFFWRLCGAPNHPQNIRPGFIHDYLYTEKPMFRKDADRLYRKMLVMEGKPRPIAWLMYLAVRCFGASHY